VTKTARVRPLAGAALAAISFFIAASVILPIVQGHQYHAVRQTISEMVLGPWGWLQTTAFCVLGVGTIALAAILRLSTERAVVAPVLLTVAGCLDFVSAAFHTVRMGDPGTTASTIHNTAGISTFLITYAVMFAAVRPFRRSAAWRGFARPTLVWACAGVAGFVAFAPPSVGQDHFGIGQRLMAASFLSWMLTTAALGRRAGAATAPGDRQLRDQAGIGVAAEPR
jgi:hypothetical protein